MTPCTSAPAALVARSAIVARSALVARAVLATLTALVLLAAPTAAAPPFHPDARFLANIVELQEARLSLDGRTVVFVAGDSLDPTLTQLWRVPADGSAPAAPFSAGGRSAWGPRFAPDSRDLAFLSTSSDTAAPQVRLIALDGGESRPLTDEPTGVNDMAFSPDGTRLAYLTPAPRGPAADPIDMSVRPGAVRLRILHLDSGATTIVSPDTFHVWRFSWSPDGKRLALLGSRPGSFGEWRRGMMAVVDANGKNYRRIAGRWDPTQGVAWSPDGALLAAYALPAARYAYPVLHLVDARGRAPAVRLVPYEHPGTDAGVAWTAGGGLVVAAHEGVRSFLTRIDPETGARTRLAQAWDGFGWGFSLSDAGDACWVASAPDSPGDVFSLARGAASPVRLTTLNPGYSGRSWILPRAVTWTSFDGRRIEGVLFEPPPEVPRPVPLVVLPHGGPSVHWPLSFYSDVHNPGQLYALNGMAALLPNVRGSTGYGEEFCALNRGDLGGGDFRDIEAAVDSLVTAGLADPARLGMYGFSYGGYMTAWTIGHTDRYRAAIVGAGPMNYLSDYAQNDLTPYWQQEFIGASPWLNPEVYLARSPITFAKNIRTPVLIIHGAEDIRVPAAQSKELFAALRELGRPVEYLQYPREGHGLGETPHQVDFFDRQLAWFRRHFEGAGAP
jgi:dipeptidyl aminopeptidase/acylaminoacyl peptidase